MSDPVFKISRSFDAPLSLVWKAYSEREHLARWWGPTGFALEIARLDFRPGGVFHYAMRGAAGQLMWGKFHYREIVPMKKIVYTSSFADESGLTARAPFAGNFPLEVLNTVEFAEAAGRTTINLSGTPYNATEEERAFFLSMFPSMNQGFTGTLNQLEAYLPVMRGGASARE